MGSGGFPPGALRDAPQTISYFSPVTLFSSHTDFSVRSFFSSGSATATAPCFLRASTVVPTLALRRASALGVYQMGELHARSWSVGATTSGGATPSFAAWMVVHRGVGISSTRA